MFVTLRAHALSHPLLLFLLFAAVFACLDPILRRFSERRAALRRGGIAATCLLVPIYLAAVIFYAATPAYFDHVEPSVASVSWLVMQGHQAYPDRAGAGLYGLPYGPLLFLLNGFTMQLLGPGIVTSKVAGACAAMASLIVLALAIRQARGEWSRAVSWAALGFLMFGVTSFWVRAEPLLLLCSSLAVLSLTVPAGPSAALAGAALGLGVNLKASAIIYLFPAFALVWRTHGTVRFAVAAGIALLVASLPYVRFDNISLAGYLSWLQAATAQGVRFSALPAALEWTIFLALPMFVMGRPEGTSRGASDTALFRTLLVACMCVSLPLAAKHGTGLYHFLPFVPAVIFASSGSRRPGPRVVVPAMLASCILVAALHLPTWVTTTTSLPSRAIISELKQIDASHAGTVAMGYSANYRPSFFRPELVFAGQPYWLDGASLMDWHWSGRPFPTAALAALRACVVEAWIVPAGAPPFVLPNAYPILGDVFPDEFRRIFEERYRLETSGQWFDVYRCRR